MGKPSPPTPPDPTVVSAAQTASNVDTATASARLAAVNSKSPYGTVSYDTIGNQQIGDQSVPQYQQTTTLSPEQQKLFDATTGLEQGALGTAGTALGNVNSALSKPIDLSSLPQIPGATDISQNAKDTQAAYMSRFNEDYPKQQEDTISRLNAEGITRGSAQYDNAMTQMDRQQTDAKNQAILAGNQEQSREFGLAGQARQQSLAEQQTVANTPIQQFATLLGLGGNAQTPTAAPNFGVNVAPTDVTGAYALNSQAQQNNYNQQMQSSGDLMGGLLGGASKLGSAWIMSDGRVKNIIRRLGQTGKGIPLYLFSYKWEDRPVVGVIAQEVRGMLPGAVQDMGGVLHVDYSMVA